MGANGKVAMGLLGFGLCMALVPLAIRKMTPAIDAQGKPLTGTQRQRGMYFNYGSTDVGPDVDWDPVTKQWKGWQKRDRTGAYASKKKGADKKEQEK
jgi:hypothetical protein